MLFGSFACPKISATNIKMFKISNYSYMQACTFERDVNFFEKSNMVPRSDEHHIATH